MRQNYTCVAKCLLYFHFGKRYKLLIYLLPVRPPILGFFKQNWINCTVLVFTLYRSIVVHMLIYLVFINKFGQGNKLQPMVYLPLEIFVCFLSGCLKIYLYRVVFQSFVKEIWNAKSINKVSINTYPRMLLFPYVWHYFVSKRQPFKTFEITCLVPYFIC